MFYVVGILVFIVILFVDYIFVSVYVKGIFEIIWLWGSFKVDCIDLMFGFVLDR